MKPNQKQLIMDHYFNKGLTINPMRQTKNQLIALDLPLEFTN